MNDARCQTQNQQWAISTSILTFNNTLSSSPSPAGSMSCTAIQDLNGNLLFSVYDGIVYDKNGFYLNQITPTIDPNSTWGGPETVIVPVPGSCTKYYIIGSEVGGNASQNIFRPLPSYFVFNSSIQNSNDNTLTGDIISGTNSILLGSIPNYLQHANILCLGVTKLRPDNTRYLFVTDGVTLYRHVISSTGISAATIAPFSFCTNASSATKSELEIYEDGNQNYKIAFFSQLDNCSGLYRPIHLVTLTSNGNYSLQDIPLPSPSGVIAVQHGLEFSPLGTYLYATTEAPPYVLCFNTQNGNQVTLPVLTNAVNYKKSFLELGYDQHLYISSTNNLAYLDDPDNPTTASWNASIPVSNPILNQYGYAWPSGSIYLPDQIDGENYSSVFNSTAQCCDFNTSWNISNYTATTGYQTWTSSNNPLNGGTGNIAYIKGLLKIPASSHITIENMELHFDLTGKIEIAGAGSLTIKGVTLSGNPNCQNMWQGVLVKPGATGNWSDQGKFYMLKDASNNPSKIEQAIIAIAAGFGGLVESRGGIFENNQYSILFFARHPSGTFTSTIENCTIRKAGTGMWYPNVGQPLKYGIYATGMTSNDLLVTTTSSTYNYFSDLDYGVYLSDNYNTDISRGIFTNCKTGIYGSLATYPTSQFDLSNNYFYSCFTAISLKGTSNDVISSNFLNPTIGLQQSNFYGIIIDGCKNFSVIGNSINRYSYGIWCLNSGSAGGTIEKHNVFYKCWRGINATGNNIGLKIKCNTFDNSSQPIAEYSAAWCILGDLDDQGSASTSNSPAGNLFYRNSTKKDIFSVPGVSSNICTGKNFCYFHHNAPAYTPTCNAYAAASNTTFIPDQTTCNGPSMLEQVNYDINQAKILIENQQEPSTKHRWINELVTYMVKERLISEAVDYLSLFGEDDDLKETLLQLQIGVRNYSAASDLLTYFCGLEGEEYERYCQYNSLIIGWGTEEKDPFKMTNEEKNTLIDIAQSQTRIAGSAQALLLTVFKEEYSNWVEGDTATQRLAFEEDVLLEKPLWTIYPNPSSSGQNVTFSIADLNEGDKISIEVYDLLGNRIWIKNNLKIADGKMSTEIKVESGMYLVKGYSEGKEYNSILMVH